MKFFHSKSAFVLTGLLVSTAAISRGSPRAGSAAAGEFPKDSLGLFEGRSITDYRPPGDLTASSWERDIGELRRIQERTSGLEKSLADTNARAVDSFAGSSDNEKLKNKQKELDKIRKDGSGLHDRAQRLEKNYQEELTRLQAKVEKTDSEVIEAIAARMNAGKADEVKISKNDVSAVLGRFAMLDLRSDIRDFLHKSKDAQRDLQVLEMKIDQSILGTYVAMKNASLINSPSFCSAVQNFAKGTQMDCMKLPDDTSANTLPQDAVRDAMKSRRNLSTGHGGATPQPATN